MPPIELMELGYLLKDACGHWVQRWLPYTLVGMRCVVPERGHGHPCGATAIQQCAICMLPTCLRHAMVHMNGDVVCVRCVNSYAQIVRGGAAHRVEAPPRPEPRSRDHHASNGHVEHAGPTEEQLRRKHLKVLGLTDPAEWDEIQEAFRRLAFKHHPDRHARSPSAKQQSAQRKFVEINAAHQWLSAHRERSAAA